MSDWAAVVLGAAGCYLLKLAGLSVPQRVLRNQRLRVIAELLPVALLSALVTIQAFTRGNHLAVDARAAGLAVATVALVLRAPFLVVVGLAAIATALIRLAVH